MLFQRAQASADAGEYALSAALLDNVVGLSPHFAQGFALRGAVRLAEGDQIGAKFVEGIGRFVCIEDFKVAKD